jgi:hypothetical protein
LRRLLSVTTVVLAATAALLTSPTAAQAGQAPPAHTEDGHYSFAVIGDVPYGDAQLAAFPAWIDQINAAEPALTFHVGDIKNGSSRCDDAYYTTIRADFDRFANPLVYTPGDNEWTDCHRVNNGAYNPLERLRHDRSVFFDRRGTTLGQHRTRVASQAAAGFPENVQLRRQGIAFAVVHVVGSNNGRQPWTGLGNTTPTPEQIAEEQARMANGIAVVRNTFAQARHRHDRAVMVLLQADMFDPTYTPNYATDISAFRPLVQTLVAEASAFRGPVYLVNGDSHVYNSDRPLATGSPWLATYGVSGSADNLERITVDGSGNNTDWLRFTVNRPRASSVLSWERIPYTP